VVSDSENVAVYRRFIEEGVGVGRLDVIDELLATGIEVPTVAPAFEPTAEGLRQMNLAFRAGFPDLKAEIDEVFENGAWVAARLTWSGTNTGELFGRPPTHRFARTTEIEIVRVEDGRIVEVRQVADVAALMAQLEG
jgi:predicted ester cyclase